MLCEELSDMLSEEEGLVSCNCVPGIGDHNKGTCVV